MKLVGKVIEVSPIEKGLSANGKEWQKQNFVIQEIEGNYPKDISIQTFGDKVSLIPAINSVVECDVNIESKKFKDKWFTNISLWQIKVIDAGATETVTQAPSTVVEDNIELPF